MADNGPRDLHDDFGRGVHDGKALREQGLPLPPMQGGAYAVGVLPGYDVRGVRLPAAARSTGVNVALMKVAPPSPAQRAG